MLIGFDFAPKVLGDDPGSSGLVYDFPVHDRRLGQQQVDDLAFGKVGERGDSHQISQGFVGQTERLDHGLSLVIDDIARRFVCVELLRQDAFVDVSDAVLRNHKEKERRPVVDVHVMPFAELVEAAMELGFVPVIVVRSIGEHVGLLVKMMTEAFLYRRIRTCHSAPDLPDAIREVYGRFLLYCLGHLITLYYKVIQKSIGNLLILETLILRSIGCSNYA